MKKLLEKTSLTRTLLLFYVFLIVALVAIRFFEHRNVIDTSKKIHTLSTTSAKRQNILNNILKSNDYLRVNELRFLY